MYAKRIRFGSSSVRRHVRQFLLNKKLLTVITLGTS